MSGFPAQSMARLDAARLMDMADDDIAAPVKTPRKPSRKRAVPADEPDSSEDALAIEFVARHESMLRFTPNLGWFGNKGTHWERDEHNNRFNLARLVAREYAKGSDDAKTALRLRSAKTVAAILTMAQSDPLIVLPAAAWDADRFALNCDVGVVDLRTNKLKTGDEYHTRITRVGPNSKMGCPTWLKFINEVFMGDADQIEFIQRLLGYCLTGDRREQKLFFFYGLGANGKSTLVDIVLRILGPYALKLPGDVLMHHAHGQHPTEIAQLMGRRLAVSSELDEGAFWNEARIKELTGDETVTARFMRQDFFEFPMTQKHIIVGNYKPRMRGGDAALARRFVLVPFLAKFEGKARDPGMLDKLWKEAPAILAWMIDGAVKWADSGLAIPASITAASSEYLSENDDVAQWLLECCEMQVGAECKASDLYESFSHWIKSRGQHVPSLRTWAERLQIVPGISKRRSGGIRYGGLQLTSEEKNRLHDLSRGGFR